MSTLATIVLLVVDIVVVFVVVLHREYVAEKWSGWLIIIWQFEVRFLALIDGLT